MNIKPACADLVVFSASARPSAPRAHGAYGQQPQHNADKPAHRGRLANAGVPDVPRSALRALMPKPRLSTSQRSKWRAFVAMQPQRTPRPLPTEAMGELAREAREAAQMCAAAGLLTDQPLRMPKVFP